MVYQTGIAAVTYTYADALLSQLDRKTFRGGAEQHQYYNFAYNLWGQSTSVKVGNQSLVSYTYEDIGGNPTGTGGGLLSEMTYGNGDSVQYFYDAFDRTEKVLYNDTGNYIEYLYTADGALGELRYKRSNGTVINSYTFEYDSLGRLIRSTEYNASGQPVQRTEHLYDEHNRLSQQNWNIQGDSFSERYVYNDPDPAVANDPGDGSLSQMTTATGDKINYTYNGLKMLSGTSITDADTNAELFKTAYAYLENDNNLTPQVEYRNVRKPNGTLIDGYKYEYDALGNITAIYESELKGSNTQRRQLAAYTYDDQNQLISETIYTYAESGTSMTPASTTVYAYTYDTAGNILSVTKDDGDAISYTYDNSQWNDLLTAYDGGKIAYEGQEITSTTLRPGIVTETVTGTPTSGNPISYYNGTRWDMIWQQGRNLFKASSSSTNTNLVSTNKIDTEVAQTYAYDADGIRISKTSSTKIYKYRATTSGGGEIMSASVDPDATFTRYLYSSTTVNHSYITQNGKVVRETIGSGTTAKVLDFIYDESGKPFALIYTNGTADSVTYYYVLNLQGDVVGLIDASGAWVAEYTYNAWGEILTATGTMAEINPLRYRGYYYDTETGFYYLQSRYYDPVTHRFINADSYASTGAGMLGYNMFAYCDNNPVIRSDSAGTSWISDVIEKMTEVINKVTGTIKKIKSRIASALGFKGTYNDFLDALGYQESSDNYAAVNSFGYMGRYQMGTLALQDAGFMDSDSNWTALANSYGVYSDEDFLNNPVAQDKAVRLLHIKIWGYILYYDLDEYIGTEYMGVIVTESGLLAACHLVGAYALYTAMLNGDPTFDGNGVAADYYMSIFGGYDVSELYLSN